MQAWLADKLEHWPIERLLPYIRNARTHSEEQIAQIAASIAEFGFTAPILAGSDGVIVAGHGRLAAARKLGLATVPVVVLEHLTPTQRRALVIADNRIAENAGWDDAMLRIELQSLQEDGFNLDITGFDTDALAAIMAGEETITEGNTDEDAAIEKSYLETMKQRWIDGFIVCSLSSDAPHIRSLRDEGYPLVLVNRFEESDIGKVDTVTSDNFQIGYDATRYLARIGHKRIAIVCGREELLLYRERLRGYRKALSDSGLPEREEYLLRESGGSNGFYYQIRELAEQGQLPDAIFCTSDPKAFVVMHALHDMGLRIRGANGRYEMTMKIAGRVVGGLHQRPEYNIDISKPELELERFPAEVWPDGELPSTLAEQVQPLFSTDFWREKWLVTEGKSRIEIALDLGDVKAGEFQEPICELELELLEGDANDVLKLARKLGFQLKPVEGKRIRFRDSGKFFQGFGKGAFIEEAYRRPVGFHGRVRQLLPGIQSFFRFFGADQGFCQKGADYGFL